MAAAQVANHTVGISCISCPGVLPITITPNSVDVYGVPLALSKDNLPIANIPSFGICGNTKKVCKPEFLTEWEEYNETVTAVGKGILSNETYIHCARGGKIMIQLAPPGASGADAPNPIDVFKDKINGIYNSIAGKIKDLKNKIPSEARDILSKVGKPIQDIMNNVEWQNAMNAAQDVVDGLTEGTNAIDEGIARVEEGYNNTRSEIEARFSDLEAMKDKFLEFIAEELGELIDIVEESIAGSLDELYIYLFESFNIDATVDKVLSDDAIDDALTGTDAEKEEQVKAKLDTIKDEYDEEFNELITAYDNFKNNESSDNAYELFLTLLTNFENNSSSISTPSSNNDDSIDAIITNAIQEEIYDEYKDIRDKITDTATDLREWLTTEKDKLDKKYSLENFIDELIEEELNNYGIIEDYEDAKEKYDDFKKDLKKAQKILNTAKDYGAFVNGVWDAILEEAQEKYGEEIAKIAKYAAKAKASLAKLNKNLTMASSVYDGLQFIASGFPTGLVVIGSKGAGTGGGASGGAGAGASGSGGSGNGNDEEDLKKIVDCFYTDKKVNIEYLKESDKITELTGEEVIYLNIITENMDGEVVDIDITDNETLNCGLSCSYQPKLKLEEEVLESYVIKSSHDQIEIKVTYSKETDDGIF